MLPKEGLTAQSHFLTLQHLAEKKQNGASALALAVLYLWQARSFPGLVAPTNRPSKELVNNQAVVNFAVWLGELDLLTAAYWLSSAYAAWVGKDVRRHEALFFTPPALSTRLIDDLVANGGSLTEHIWFDPASGGAAFIAPVAKRISEVFRKEGMPAKSILDHISTHVLGNDIDPCLSAMSKQFLRMVLYKEIAEAGFEPDFYVTTYNALADLRDYAGRVDVVICNPPYRKMKNDEVAAYRSQYEAVITGQPNLYSLFFQLALDCMKPSGIAGLITPTSYLTGQSFSKLRAHVKRCGEVLQIDTIPNVGAFFGVEQETAIAVIRNGTVGTDTPQACSVSHYKKEGGFEFLGKCFLPFPGEAWPIPRDKGDVELLKKCGSSPYRLSDYGYQPRIGHFVWNRDQRETFGSIPKRKSSSIFPLVWSSNVSANSGFEHGRSQSVVAASNYVDMGSPAAGGIIRQPCVVLQRVTSSDQPRRLVASPLSEELLNKFGGVVGENHVIFLIQTDSAPKISTQLLAEVLRSNVIDRLFRCISGAVNVSIYELGHLPLPHPEDLKAAIKDTATLNEAIELAFFRTAERTRNNV